MCSHAQHTVGAREMRIWQLKDDAQARAIAAREQRMQNERKAFELRQARLRVQQSRQHYLDALKWLNLLLKRS